MDSSSSESPPVVFLIRSPAIFARNFSLDVAREAFLVCVDITYIARSALIEPKTKKTYCVFLEGGNRLLLLFLLLLLSLFALPLDRACHISRSVGLCRLALSSRSIVLLRLSFQRRSFQGPFLWSFRHRTRGRFLSTSRHRTSQLPFSGRLGS